MISAGSVGTFCSKITLPASSTTPTFPSPTHQDQQNAPSHRSFLDARGRADLDPLIATEGDAHSSSKHEPQPPRYTIFRIVIGQTARCWGAWECRCAELPAWAEAAGRPGSGVFD